MTEIRTYYQAIFKRTVKDSPYGITKTYKKGSVFIRRMSKKQMQDLIADGTAEDVHGHGVSTYFDVKEDLEFVEVTEKVRKSTKKVRMK